MNSKKHTLSRKLLATLLTAAMLITMFPATVFANGSGSSEPIGTVDQPITATSNGVTVNKYVSGDSENGYNLTLEAYASNVVTTTESTQPLDIVLVLDVSGSMDEALTSEMYYKESSRKSWSYSNLSASYMRYFYNDGNEYYQVHVNGNRYNWRLYYIKDTQEITLGSGGRNDNWEGTLYTQESSEYSKLDTTKNAVKNFIDSVASSEAEHQVALVTFESDAEIVSGFTNNFEELKNSVDNLEAEGGTHSDYGLTQAQTLINGLSDDNQKVVILFTDGQPGNYGFEGSYYYGENHSDGYKTATEAINTSMEMKSVGVQVYTIGMMDEANPNDTGSDTNLYMNAVSSKYPTAKATGYKEPEFNIWGDKIEDGSMTVELGTPSEDDYYYAADSAGSLNEIFSTIFDKISSLKVNPDSDAVLSDTLSDFVNFPADLNANSEEISAKYVEAQNYDSGSGAITWKQDGTDQQNIRVDIDGKTISITGFDYKEHAVTDDNGTVTGGKLVVTFPIEVDVNACLNDTTIHDGWYPTNNTTDNRAKLSYKSDAEAGSNDTVTALDQSPKMQLTNLDANGTDVTVQVFVDGKKVSNPDQYLTFARDTKDTTYDYFNRVSNTDGVLTYDFSYNPDEGGHDCVDIKVGLQNGTTYLLQGVYSYQSHGKSGTENVIDNKDGTYTIDNVTADNNNDVDCTIYLQTKYGVAYYQDETLLTDNGYNDQNVYIAKEDVTSTTDDEEKPSEGNSAWMNWKNSGYKTTINLQALPSVAGNVVEGWFLGSAEGSQQTPSSAVEVYQVITSADDNRIIKFYATATAQYTITINYEDESGEPLKTAYGDTQNAGYAYSFDVSTDTNGEIPFIIEKEGSQYVFDHFKDGSGSLSGTLNGNVEITAVYLIDANENDVPDVHDATVTYKIENGTWSDDTATDKTEQFELKTFDEESNAWVDKSPAPTLGETIPTGMKPNDEYLADDAGWDSEISAETLVVNGAVYTYKFTKAKAPALTVEKTVVSVGDQDVTDQQNIPDAQVGNAIVYQIEVKNTGNVNLESINVTDTMKIPGAEGSLIDSNKNVSLYSDKTCQTVFTGVFDLNKSESKTLYAKYEVVQDDAGKQLTNSVAATSGTTSGTDDAPPVNVDAMYALNYDGNAQQGGTVADTPGSTSHHAGDDVALNADKPTHSDVNDTKVVFIGWSLTQTNQIYSAGENYGTTVDQVTFVDKDITVYAVWGYDTNDDGTADATQVMIQPAAMTIYTGGDGYLGTVDDENGTTVGAKESGLPEPGFYFTLPYDMNQAIKTAAGTSGNAADLSQYLSINAEAHSDTGTTEARSWTIQLYDPDGTSHVNGKYVYSFDPGEGQDPVRMQFTNDNEIIISDKFDVKEALHQEYTMSLYTGSVLANTVQAVVKINGQNDLTATVGLWDSTLTIRGVTDEGTSTGIVENVSDTVSTVTASTEGETPTYYINGSQIQVTNQGAVQLLVDSIVDDGNNVHDKLLEMAKDELPSSYDGAEFKYLDLVDSSNGNVWVTMGDNDSLTVYWPYPAGTDKNDDFTIIHYKGLDREFDLKDLETQTYTLETLSTENGKLECTDQGIKFTVNSFSPFALVYDKQTSGGGSTGGGTTPTPPALNTQDHFSYVVGYEDGMVKPENAITRAEVASIFYRLLKDDVRDANTTDVSEFSDVSASDWYGTTVATLSAMDIVRGYEDGTFRPNAPITRAEFAAIATRFFEETGAEYEPGTFDDVTGDEWFANAIADAVELGLIGGYPDGTVRPNNNITRAEACAVVNRTLGRIPHVDHLLPADEMRTWPDNNPSDWFYADMQEATNGHEYEWTKEDGQKVEEWTEILDKDWEDR